MVVPTEVWSEFTARFDGRDRIEAFRDRGGIRVISPDSTDLRTEFERELDCREAAVMAYAIDIDADWVFIDECDRPATATCHGLSTTGVVDVISSASDRK